MNGSASSIKTRISRIEITDENLAGRAGLCFLFRYIRDTKIVMILEQRVTNLRKSLKGNPLSSVFHQVLCFFINGENFHLTHFDHLKNDQRYAGVIVLSSHSVKRFFGAFRLSQALQLRKILHMLFIWQLKKEKPEKLIAIMATMFREFSKMLSD